MGVSRRRFITGVVLALTPLGATASAQEYKAQQAVKIPRIGILGSYNWPIWEAFRQGLHELDYVEGRTVVIESRWAEGKEERFPQLAADLVSRRVDVIVTWGTPATLAAKNASKTIPIVMAASGDPVGTGLITSLVRPGGNITGSSSLSPVLEGKRIELLKEIVPTLSRVAVLWNPANPLHEGLVREIQGAVVRLGVQLQPVGVRSLPEFETAFATMTKERPDALIVQPDNFFAFHRRRIVDFAAKTRLPAVFTTWDFAEAGGLMVYGANYSELFRRAATYVDKILKDAKPGDLPVEQPSNFELVINLKTAKSLGLTIPPSLLLRADQVIE